LYGQAGKIDKAVYLASPAQTGREAERFEVAHGMKYEEGETSWVEGGF
jgi:hypothetical protein